MVANALYGAQWCESELTRVLGVGIAIVFFLVLL